MTLPGFFALSSAWLFLLVPPVVIFYFLKLRRPRMEVPSLVLWRQVLQDKRVNSPFQRFLRNILLLLQLLLLLFLILAAMQPYWRGDPGMSRRLPILIDCSASMGALDKAGGQSRLDVAKQHVNDIIDGLLSDQEVCLISFGRTGRKLTDFTNNKRVLRDALDQLKVLDLPSDVEDGLRIAEALSRATPFDRALLFSDGNFPMPSHFQLPFKIDYQKLPPAGPNMGITAVSAQRNGEKGWAIFVNVESSAQPAMSGTLKLFSAGKLLDQVDVNAGKDRNQRLVFKVQIDKRTSFEVRLEPDGFDSLASDNVAYLDLAPPRPLWIYCPPTLPAHRFALAAQSGVRLFPEPGQTTAPAGETYDLVITDRLEDRALTSNTIAYMGVVPEELRKLVKIGGESTTAVDWLRTSPLLQHVDLSDLVVLDGPQNTSLNVRENDFENLGYEVVAYGQLGPLIIQKREEAKISYYFLFNPSRSTLPFRVGFPVLMANLSEIAMEQAGLADAHGNTTGVLPPLTLTPDRSVTIEGPDGQTWEEKCDARGVLSGVPAYHVGRYRIHGPDIDVGASLLSPDETSLEGHDQINFAEASVSAATGKARVDRSFWPTLAAIALVLLVVEWWFYQKRPGGFPA
jgi:hypothetical protein